MKVFSVLDIIAILWFLFCFIGYSIFVNMIKQKKGNLFSMMYQKRLAWMRHVNARDDRAVDVITLGNLMRSASFFASTSIIIVAALIPMIGYGKTASEFLKVIPFVTDNSSPLWELKAMFLLIVFIYAFFKYTWSLRQYNYASILIVSTDVYKKVTPLSKSVARRNAMILSNAARHFSMGVRSFYFGISILTWFIHPVLFMVSTILVVLVSYRREFLSRALNIIGSK